MTNFRVTFDEVAKLLYFKDTAEVGETQVIVKFPDEIIVDYGRTLNVANDWLLGVLSRQDLVGKLMQGEYTFTVKRYNIGGTVLNSEETEAFTLSAEPITPLVTITNDPYTPSLILTDSTDWSVNIDDVWVLGTLLRVWNASNGLHIFGPSLQPTLSLYDNGYYAGDYEYTFETTTRYDHINGWVLVKLYSIVSGSFTVNKPVMLPELAELFNCLWLKISAGSRCKDATYSEMLSDYQLAIAMSQNFILNGQAGVTGTIQNDLLFGSDCSLGILSLLRKWGCEDQAVEDALLVNYDWCLCGGSGLSDGNYGDVSVTTNGTIIEYNDNSIENSALAISPPSTIKGNSDVVAANTEDMEVPVVQALLSIDDIISLSGAPEGGVDLGTFTGSGLPSVNNLNIKQAIQAIKDVIILSTTTANGLMSSDDFQKLRLVNFAFPTGTMSWDANNGHRAFVQLTADITVAQPSNTANGDVITVTFVAIGGNRTVTFSTAFKKGDGTDMGSVVITSGTAKSYVFVVSNLGLHYIVN